MVLADYCGIESPLDRAFQVSCPVYWDHAHGDVSRSARIYPRSNTMNCFAMHGTMDAVHIVCHMEGVDSREAMRRLVKKYDLEFKTPDYLKKWSRLVHPEDPSGKKTTRAYLDLAEALRIYCERWWPECMFEYLDGLANLDQLFFESYPNIPPIITYTLWLREEEIRIKERCEHLARAQEANLA